jgi:hypothetical protein
MGQNHKWQEQRVLRRKARGEANARFAESRDDAGDLAESPSPRLVPDQTAGVVRVLWHKNGILFYDSIRAPPLSEDVKRRQVGFCRRLARKASWCSLNDGNPGHLILEKPNGGVTRVGDWKLNDKEMLIHLELLQFTLNSQSMVYRP